MRPDDIITRQWILNLAVDHPVPLWLLFPAVNAEALNVRIIPGFASEDYAEALRKLLGDQMIEISDRESTSLPDLPTVIHRLQGMSGDRRPPWEWHKIPGVQVSFALTARGGEMWERLANPDWGRLINENSDLTSCELISSNRDLLMAYIGWYPEIHPHSIVWDTIELVVRTDFPILYWKRLPTVYHVLCQLGTVKPRWGCPAPLWFRAWREATMSWCTAPWDLPGWRV